MKAYVANPISLLGVTLTGALRWEGHSLVSSIAEADVVFDTTHGVIYRKDRALARFIFGELLGPGDVSGTIVGDWLRQYVRDGLAPAKSGGARITDVRDVCLGMIAAAERGMSGEFDVIGPFYTFDEMVDGLSGMSPAHSNIALPELGVAFRPVEDTLKDVVAWLKDVEACSSRTMVA
jgi:hypothetical protein